MIMQTQVTTIMQTQAKLFLWFTEINTKLFLCYPSVAINIIS